MPVIQFRIRYHGAVPGSVNLGQREFNRIKADAWNEVGKHWFEHFRPKHFTKAGAEEYGYTPRKGEASGTSGKAFWRSYTGEKQRRFGHTLPLVFTGDANSLRSQCQTASIYATSKGVRVALTRAQKASLMSRNTTIDMVDELTRVSLPEIDQLERVFDDRMQRSLDDLIVQTHIKTVAGWHTANDTFN